MSLEILAPAGGPEAVKAAVRAGADAVYLGYSSFSARASAANFDERALTDAVQYCHQRGVKVHLALNTILREEELDQALEVARLACRLSIDAIIVQDMGLCRLLKQAAPGLSLHASTQLSVHTLAGVEWMAKAGFDRVVLARELSREEIAAIAKKSPIELEVFVHGALCASVSGQCYMSAFLGGRSGNRGRCAQPCRLPFRASDGCPNALSLKDYSIIDHLRELHAMGVASAKIEGRMKRPEYCAAAVAACRASLDEGKVPRDLMDNLRNVFSRSGFTDGYYTGRRGRKMVGIRQKEDVTAAQKALPILQKLIASERPSIPLHLRFEVEGDRPARLTVWDEEGHQGTAEGPIPALAQSRPLDEQSCAKQLKKTGGTPFFVRELDMELEEGLNLPLSSLNALRRQGLEMLLDARGKRDPIPFSLPKQENGSQQLRRSPSAMHARFESIEQIPNDFKAELVFLSLTASKEDLAALSARFAGAGVEVPRAMFGREETIRRRLRIAREAGYRHALVHTWDGVQLAQEEGFNLHAGFGLAMANRQALQSAREGGFQSAAVWLELSLGQASELTGILPVGYYAYGYLPLMLMRNCPAADACKKCDGRQSLIDRKGTAFPVRCAGGAGEVFNSVPLCLADRMDRLSCLDFVHLHFTEETRKEVKQILHLFEEGVTPPFPFTRGLSQKGVL